MAATYSKLATFPRHRLLDLDLARCRAGELDLLGAFGPPTLESSADDTDPAFFWDLEWSCGLVMSLRFAQLTQTLTIRLDEPDTAHALRHLGFEVADLWVLEDEDPTALPPGVAPLERVWELWGPDGDGTRVRIGAGLTERDARCRAGAFDAIAAPSIYEVRRAGA